MEDSQALLIAEQLNRLKDNIDARLKRLEVAIDHYQTLDAEKMNLIKSEISTIRKAVEDHETRIRTVDDSVIALTTKSTIAQAAQAGLTLVAAAIAAWLGGQR